MAKNRKRTKKTKPDIRKVSEADRIKALLKYNYDLLEFFEILLLTANQHLEDEEYIIINEDD